MPLTTAHDLRNHLPRSAGLLQVTFVERRQDRQSFLAVTHGAEHPAHHSLDLLEERLWLLVDGQHVQLPELEHVGHALLHVVLHVLKGFRVILEHVLQPGVHLRLAGCPVQQLLRRLHTLGVQDCVEHAVHGLVVRQPHDAPGVRCGYAGHVRRKVVVCAPDLHVWEAVLEDELDGVRERALEVLDRRSHLDVLRWRGAHLAELVELRCGLFFGEGFGVALDSVRNERSAVRWFEPAIVVHILLTSEPQFGVKNVCCTCHGYAVLFTAHGELLRLHSVCLFASCEEIDYGPSLSDFAFDSIFDPCTTNQFLATIDLEFGNLR